MQPCSLAAATLLSAPALAQNTHVPEEIVVTAEHREAARGGRCNACTRIFRKNNECEVIVCTGTSALPPSYTGCVNFSAKNILAFCRAPNARYAHVISGQALRMSACFARDIRRRFENSEALALFGESGEPNVTGELRDGKGEQRGVSSEVCDVNQPPPRLKKLLHGLCRAPWHRRARGRRASKYRGRIRPPTRSR